MGDSKDAFITLLNWPIVESWGYSRRHLVNRVFWNGGQLYKCLEVVPSARSRHYDAMNILSHNTVYDYKIRNGWRRETQSKHQQWEAIFKRSFYRSVHIKMKININGFPLSFKKSFHLKWLWHNSRVIYETSNTCSPKRI